MPCFEMKPRQLIRDPRHTYQAKSISSQLGLSQTDHRARMLARFLDAKLFACSYANGISVQKIPSELRKLAIDDPYQKLIGSLLYLTKFNIPYIAFSLGYLSQYYENTQEHH